MNQSKLREAIALMQEYNALNTQYGRLSCFDYPQQYNSMDALQIEVGELVSELTKDNDISINGLSQAIENIALDIDNGNIPQSANITLYTQDGFIQYIVKRSKMLSSEAKRLEDMLDWMQEKERAGYIATRFILEWENDRNNISSFYYDDRMSFTIVVE